MVNGLKKGDFKFHFIPCLKTVLHHVKENVGHSLAVQWLGLHILIANSPGSIHG